MEEKKGESERQWEGEEEERKQREEKGQEGEREESIEGVWRGDPCRTHVSGEQDHRS